MQNAGKRNILGVLINAVDCEGAEEAIVQAALDRQPLSVSALAVHGLMTGVLDCEQKYRLNRFDMLVPDGQPVRWALNWLHGCALKQRVYGPTLTLRICERAADLGLPVFFYGGTPDILHSLKAQLENRFPHLRLAGCEPSKFRQLTPNEKEQVADRIRSSGAAIAFIGLGCPRQEVFVYEFSGLLKMPVLAVGAAFPFIAGMLPQAPAWMQNAGVGMALSIVFGADEALAPLFFLNPAYLFLLMLQRCGASQFTTDGQQPRRELLFG